MYNSIPSSLNLSLIIPCYNEENTIENCVEKVRKITQEQNLNLEIIIVNDCSTDNSAEKLKEISAKYPEIKIFTHEKNRGKGAALRTGLLSATGDFVGIQDADDEYNPMEYLELLKPLIENKADVVYGSRYLKPGTRRVLYFWHTWMNKSLTFVSNMFTNLDITDMETCYKLFRKEAIAQIAPNLKEERFGFEPEITCKVAQAGFRVYECAISYNPRSYEEGKKIGWKDGIRALYCILHYSANTAPLPMQLLLYFFIGGFSLFVNVGVFTVLHHAFNLPSIFDLNANVIIAYIASTLVNYLLCIAILFRHKARWSSAREFIVYLIGAIIMGFVDYGLMWGINAMGVPVIISKTLASGLGFILNFALRRNVVFPEKKLYVKR
jgi:glycosyltransferase involved in cell wall biosynthesis